MKKVKEFIKNHGGKLLIGSAIFLVLGAAAFCIGGYMAGWDIIGWFSSPSAFFVYAFVILFFLILACLWYWAKRSKDNG